MTNAAPGHTTDASASGSADTAVAAPIDCNKVFSPGDAAGLLKPPVKVSAIGEGTGWCEFTDEKLDDISVRTGSDQTNEVIFEDATVSTDRVNFVPLPGVGDQAVRKASDGSEVASKKGNFYCSVIGGQNDFASPRNGIHSDAAPGLMFAAVSGARIRPSSGPTRFDLQPDRESDMTYRMRTNTLWERGLVILVALALAANVASARAQDSPALAPPVAPVRPVTDDYFGTKVVDNYRYFENLKDPEVQQWMKAQADYTRTVLDRIPGRTALLARLQELDAAERAVVFDVWRRPGNRYFYLKRLAGESVAKLYERDGLAGAERVLVDPATIRLAPSDQGRGPSTVEGVDVSDNGRYVAVGITPGGAERDTELHIISAASGTETGDVILRVPGGGASWLPGNRSFVYTKREDLPANAPPAALEQKLRSYLHVLGTDPRRDPALFGYDVTPSINVDSTHFAQVEVASHYALGYINSGVAPNSAFYVAPVDAIGKPAVPWRKVADFADQVSAATIHGDDLYLLSFKNASRYQVLRTNARHPDLARAEVVVPESEAVIRNIGVANDALYVNELDGGIDRALRVPFGARPKAEYLTASSTNHTVAAADANVDGALVFRGSPTSVSSIYAYDPRTRQLIDTKLQPEGPNDRPSTIESVQVKVRSYDGTMVPLTIVYPRGLTRDGSHPTLLNGYGAYGYPSIVWFDPTQLAEYELGVVQATCHVRGGGEFGEEWHLAGKGPTKPNTWRDFIACAEYLIAQGYTSPTHLAGEAGSAGGILIGRAIEARPDLFAAAVADVPLSDLVRSETTPNGGLNIGEFGSTKTEAGFRALYAMSPYANVKDGVKYPAVLVTTGINDPRVDPWQPAKLAARLQAATASGKPVFLRVDYTAGHGVASNHEQALEQQVDMWSFILWQTGHPAFQPRSP